jgi:hypothetical protein
MYKCWLFLHSANALVLLEPKAGAKCFPSNR